MNYSIIIFSLLFFYFMYIQFNPLDGTQFEKEKEKKIEEKKTRTDYLQSEKDTKDKKRQKLASMEDELKIEQDKWLFRDNDKIQKIQTEIETLQKSLEEDQEKLDIETDTDENPESETLEENPDSNSELETLKMELAELKNFWFWSDNRERMKELEEKIKEIEQKENIGQ